MSQDWHGGNLPDWLAQAATVAGSLVAGGAAKPVWDWWQGRGKERRAEQESDALAAASLRKELRDNVRELRADLDKRDDEIEAVKRELYQLLARIAELTAENHAIRADRHRLLNWITVFYGDLQRRWIGAGLPGDEYPTLPEWVKSSPDGPTASFREPSS